MASTSAISVATGGSSSSKGASWSWMAVPGAGEATVLQRVITNPPSVSI
ncbi:MULTISPECIES: hypothetical protein [Mycobacterium avium complex (MAC)]|uniref:Uncharacterized protein n=1 Tax=Mycobacterium bouchedurhonense TaxID=701041 RepID=A0AAW5S7X1_MYCBC|nr:MULTISPECIES: hypothetical protein [Mycobacterium avium complex (MAC)]ETB38579.1 hypothetical protein O974_27200 [Mycobacterium avium 11-0986]MCV6991466.1 hypothetical protein [Mycobacterium bouchedurhonense]